MNRDRQLAFCSVCVNRSFNPKTGLLCGLTAEKPNFENECPTYSEDPDEISRQVASERTTITDSSAQISENQLALLRAEQNFPYALAAGLLVGLFGALLWGLITVWTQFQIGLMAVAVGAGIGFSMRFVGKGIDQKFGVAGATIAVLSCVLGNFLSVIGFLAIEADMKFFETLFQFDYSYFFPVMVESFQIMDILFYGIAAFEGYKFAFRTFSGTEIHDLKTRV